MIDSLSEWEGDVKAVPRNIHTKKEKGSPFGLPFCSLRTLPGGN